MKGRFIHLSLPLLLTEAFNGPGVPVVPTTTTSTPTTTTTTTTTTEVPTVVTDNGGSGSEVKVNEYTKAIVHDFAAKKDCWDGLAAASSDCWTGPDGVSYRYACSVEGGGKVLTDICEDSTCNPSSCLGEWTWHEEYSKTCYNDGAAFYQYECSGLGLDEAYEASSEAGRIEGTSQHTCQQLGWETSLEAGKSPFVCSQSKINDECPVDMTFAEAEATCSTVGARLCTSEELANDEAKGGGCKADCKGVWSADTCDGGHTWQAGAAKCLKDFPSACGDSSAKAAVRCCADSVNMNVGPSAGLPAGYSLATASDFKLEDKICGGTPTKQYSCWTNAVTGQAQRFACTADSTFVWSQSCGTDATCAGSSCSGDWFNQNEELNQCYEDPSGNLYSYDC